MRYHSAKQVYDVFYNKAEKKFGQNFLFDMKITSRIVDAAGDIAGKVVVEIGPGPGGLTLEILKRDVKKLYVIEYDQRWVDVWNELKTDYGDRLEIIHADALQFDIYSLQPNIVISNLPYNISTELLLKWLPRFDMCETFVLMFQKEVADRLYADCGSKEYGRLSVITQWKSCVNKVFDLAGGSFFPPPKVKSTVVCLKPFKRCDVQCADRFVEFSRLLTVAFAHRRKAVSRFLKTISDHADNELQSLGYTPQVRAEEISVQDYVKLFQSFLVP